MRPLRRAKKRPGESAVQDALLAVAKKQPPVSKFERRVTPEAIRPG
jgi:hypothetical protein